MICQNCGNREATTHIKQVVNGEATELHLCSDCAHRKGFGQTVFSPGLGLTDIFGSFLRDIPAGRLSGRALRCEGCGSTFEDIAAGGMVGCAECYDTFGDRLEPSIVRIHGNTSHVGKIPKSIVSPEDGEAKRVQQLRDEMSRAVAEQNFEEAARLRDEIAALEDKI